MLALMLVALWGIGSVLDEAKKELAKINIQLKAIGVIAAKHNAAWDAAEEANSRRQPMRGNVVTGRMGYWPKD